MISDEGGQAYSKTWCGKHLQRLKTFSIPKALHIGIFGLEIFQRHRWTWKWHQMSIHQSWQTIQNCIHSPYASCLHFCFHLVSRILTSTFRIIFFSQSFTNLGGSADLSIKALRMFPQFVTSFARGSKAGLAITTWITKWHWMCFFMFLLAMTIWIHHTNYNVNRSYVYIYICNIVMINLHHHHDYTIPTDIN